jgi:fused signal recognition particle receptor
MDPQPNDLISLLVVLGGLLGSGAAAFFVAKRARASRRRQIEASEPKSVSKGSGKLKDWAADEDEAQPKPDELKPSEDDTGPRPPAQVVPFPSPAEKGQNKPGPSPDTAALKQGLARTRSGWVAKLGQILAGKKQLDPQVLEELERVLLTADIGVKTANSLLEDLRSSLSRNELTNDEAMWRRLKARTSEILDVEAAPFDTTRARPFVLLVIGVNGTGKTTTIGKLAAKFSAEGKKVLLAAGDTFRAAAVAQLEVWGTRTGCPVVKGKEGADPSSVLFEAVKRAQTEGLDVVIADTAGRLHTKTDLMAELEKLGRVLTKAMPGAPHETWLVLDSTSGQNAIAQAQIFTQAMKVSGIVLTKLDGTAKGGVILGITDQLKIPVRFIGVGERVEDLRTFDVQEFVDALYEKDEAEVATSARPSA